MPLSGGRESCQRHLGVQSCLGHPKGVERGVKGLGALREQVAAELEEALSWYSLEV